MITVDFQNHQDEVVIDAPLCDWIWETLPQVIREVRAVSLPSSVFLELVEIDIAFINQIASDQAHRQFMNIPGATDVITFNHGELLICPMVAERQSAEYDEPLWRELMRYIVHGCLHLAGYDDQDEESSNIMHDQQEKIVFALPPHDLANHQ